MSTAERDVLPCGGAHLVALRALFEPLGLAFETVEPGREIPGSHWGGSEAGLIEATLFLRPDTPVHSVLHEACHYVCMTPARRACLDTDAGGTGVEEAAVCYLSIVLAERIPGFGRARMLADMDRWGYTFRLGSAGAWFAGDARDAREWLETRGLLAPVGRFTQRLRTFD